MEQYHSGTHRAWVIDWTIVIKLPQDCLVHGHHRVDREPHVMSHACIPHGMLRWASVCVCKRVG